MAEDMGRAERTVRRAYDAFNSGDYETAVDQLHPEVEWQRVAGVEQPLHGRAAVREFMAPNVFAEQHTEIHAIEAIGDALVVDCTFTGRGAQSGVELDQRGYHLWRIKDGLAIEFRYFLDRDDAVAAARG